MFSEILKIIPKLDANQLNEMERSLSKRFTKVAKSFGKGIKNIFKGGAIAGLAGGLINKLLNPLKETQDAIERTLSSSDDIATNAKQFGTTSGKLAKLIASAKATGLDQDSLFTLITKFQSAVAQNQIDPTKSASVAQFGNNPDSAESFFDFIQSLQKTDKNSQIRAQTDVFGEKQILKLADFLQQDFASLFQKIGLDKVSAAKLTGSIDGQADLNDLLGIENARLSIKDQFTKGNLLNQGTIGQLKGIEKRRLDVENQRIANFKNIVAVAETADKINLILEKGVFKIGEFITQVTPKINAIVVTLEKISMSSVWRSLNPFATKKGK